MGLDMYLYKATKPSLTFGIYRSDDIYIQSLALIPNDDVILSNLYLYKSCISKLQREELELQIVSNIMRLIDSNSFDLEKKRMHVCFDWICQVKERQ